MDPIAPAAWIGAPVLIIAGLVLILARDRIGIAYGKQYENLRGRLRSLPREPAYLRPMAPVVGAAWLGGGLLLRGLLLWK